MAKDKIIFPERCLKCKYYFCNKYNVPMCQFIVATGEPRGEPVTDHCSRYERKSRKRKERFDEQF